MSEAGQIDFAVYGYMSRGNHEGTTGIALYRYESAGNALTERLYLPASTDYGNLRQDINQLCYLSGGQTLYVLMNHAVYSVDLTGKEYMVVADGLTEENFAVSTDASRIAWQDGADIYRSTKLHVMNLETGKKDEISFPDQTVIRLIGFVGTDLVYGLAHPNEQLTMDGRVTGLPLYAVEIVGSNMEMETRYEKPGVSLVDVRIQDSRVHLSRMRQIGSGYQPMDEDTLVCNEEVSKDPLDGIATLNDSAKGRLYCVKLDAGKTARSTKFDEIWYVYTSVENRIKRLMASRGYSEEKCRGIMANQASEDDYRSFATRVLDNNGGIEDIRKQIASFLGKED